MKNTLTVLLILAFVLVALVLSVDISSTVVPGEQYRIKTVDSSNVIYVYANNENTCIDETAALQKSFIEIETELQETIRQLKNRFNSQHDDKHTWEERALHAEERMQDILRKETGHGS